VTTPGSRVRTRVLDAIELIGLRLCEQARNQRPKIFFGQSGNPHETGVQPLELMLGHRVEVDATNTLLGTRPLHPTEQDLGGTRIGDSPLA